MDAVLRCSRYAFGPNRLHYCGPDATSEILAYIESGHEDPGLQALIFRFATLYPYLNFIAHANRIRDPFDERVIEAYWIGNSLLDAIDRKRYLRYLEDEIKIQKKIGRKSFSYVKDKLKQGALPHHSFHVLNVWKQQRGSGPDVSLESLDACCIGWGKITRLSGPNVTLETQALAYDQRKFHLTSGITRNVTRSFEADTGIEALGPGDLVSYHWDVICEPIAKSQAQELDKYTLRSIELANQTL